MKYCYYVRINYNDSISVKYLNTFDDLYRYIVKRLYHIFKNSTYFGFYEKAVKIECGVRLDYKHTIIERKVISSDYLVYGSDILFYLYDILKSESDFYQQIVNVEFENEKN